MELHELVHEGLSCPVCREQPPASRLRMELQIRRTARDLWRLLAEPLTTEERRATEAELDDARAVLEELRRHRAHTLFYKIVALGDGADRYRSIFDGKTVYRLGVAVRPATTSADGGCFVHTSIDDAAKSVASFPRASRAWSLPRALLAVRGEGKFQFRHGKVMFEAITPVAELPMPSSGGAQTLWRR